MITILFAINKVDKKNTDVDYMAWMCCDVMVRGWLTTTMEKNIRNSVKYESAPRADGLKQILIGTQQKTAYGSIYYKKLQWTYDKIVGIKTLIVI
uniref:Uncharacterized protein n=1 Tax=Lactuca sativa TaxID=4236 RepID=A0A9R1VTT3_LACSA|nr:hypothetical protein LSAT_V11C400188920 [Lactuca sativa]